MYNIYRVVVYRGTVVDWVVAVGQASREKVASRKGLGGGNEKKESQKKFEKSKNQFHLQAANCCCCCYCQHLRLVKSYILAEFIQSRVD